eukprot:SAG22_NODE_5284_length_1046_cov_1.050686_2_plen_138_part_00
MQAPPRVAGGSTFETEPVDKPDRGALLAGAAAGDESHNPVHADSSVVRSGFAAPEDHGRKEETPAYMVLRKHGLLVTDYRLESHADMEAVAANSSRPLNCALSAFCCLGKMFGFCQTFEVPAGHIKRVTDGKRQHGH